MKRILLILCVALTTGIAMANSYFGMGDGSTLRIHPSKVNSSITVPVWAHFEGRLDSWELEFTCPNSMHIDAVVRNHGMDIPYLQYDGSAAMCEPELTIGITDTVCSSIITEFGYWDPNNDGIYEPYGTVKWGPGDIDTLFVVTLDVIGDCTGDTICIEETLSCSFDWRGGEVNENHMIKIALQVGYDPGDVNGDNTISLSDLTALVNYLLTDEGLNAYQLVAADVNNDGYINISDVSELTNMLLTMGYTDLPQLWDDTSEW